VKTEKDQFLKCSDTQTHGSTKNIALKKIQLHEKRWVDGKQADLRGRK
jgi:hypothetical protein